MLAMIHVYRGKQKQKWKYLQGVYRGETGRFKPLFTEVFKGVKQGVYRGETGCFKPMSTGVFTWVKQGVYKGETGCLQG